LAAGWLLLAAGCGSSAPAPKVHDIVPPARLAAMVQTGRQVFISQDCGSCHALAAVRSRGGAGPDFDTSERLSRGQIRRSLVEGVNGMPSYAARLTERSQAAVTEFLYRVTRERDEGPRAAVSH
jgi:mono/diheme cytochrome c family protein